MVGNGERDNWRIEEKKERRLKVKSTGKTPVLFLFWQYRLFYPCVSSQPPQVRFLAWQGQDMEKYSTELDAAWHADGSPVDVNAAEHKLLESVNSCHDGDATRRDERFLYLWLAHPLFNRSFFEAELLGKNGQPLSLFHYGSGSVTGETPDKNRDNTNWGILTFRNKEGADYPAQADLRLRYTVGPWENVDGPFKADSNIIMSAGTGTVGQDASGKAFINISYDPAKKRDKQFAFAAVTQDGRRLISTGGSGVKGGGQALEVYKFNVSLSQIKEFQPLAQSIRETVIQNVALKRN